MYTKMKIADKKSSRTFAQLQRAQAAFSLVEVTMAMGLMAFCLVAMLGMLPVGLKQERDSNDQLTAMQVLTAVENDFQTVLNGATGRYHINTSSASGGSFYVDSAMDYTTQSAGAAYNVVYSFPGAGGNQPDRMHVFVARIRPGNLAQQNVVAEGIAQSRL